jgi:aspartyl-tRNA(Asn)/glutamyl-tRNA(Gln) amidotransferase subunit A
VLRVAKAYEDATPWRSRRPVLTPGASPLPLPPVPDAAKADIPQTRRDEIAAVVRRAGLRLAEKHFEQLCAAAPYVEEMVGALDRRRAFHDEPASVFLAGG